MCRFLFPLLLCKNRLRAKTGVRVAGCAYFRPGRRQAAGFALLEVLIAFVIAALALGVLSAAALAGLRAAQVAGHYEGALAHARSHLAALGRGGGLLPGDQQGDDGGGFLWHSHVRLLATAPVARGDAATVARGPQVALYAVAVTISWQDGERDRSVVLRSERVGAPPPAAR
jgi:general secretion pathway protein I